MLLLVRDDSFPAIIRLTESPLMNDCLRQLYRCQFGTEYLAIARRLVALSNAYPVARRFRFGTVIVGPDDPNDPIIADAGVNQIRIATVSIELYWNRDQTSR